MKIALVRRVSHLRGFRFLWLAGALVFVGGGALAYAGLRPLLRSTEAFLPLAAEPRVRFEPGAEAAAAVIARALPAAIATVERAQFRPFARPVAIQVCATTASFERFGFGVSGAGGFVLNGRLFLSPKTQNTAERLPRLLTHELSHLHFDQRLGMIRHQRALPGWFREGLAVHVSGSGAENVSVAEARAAIAAGRVFQRHERGSLLRPQTPARDGLPAHLFYRESALFVAFLAQRDAAAFQRLLLALEDGEAFAGAFASAYGCGIEACWRDFVAAVVSETR